jgi:hypothetical protein
MGDVAGQRNRRAGKLVRKRLREAQTPLEAGDRKGFYDGLLRAVWGYLGDRFGLEQGELSRDRIREVLLERGAEEADANSMLTLLDTCEMAVYAPVSDGASMQETFSEAEDLLTRLEEKLA